jgi:hypothetical protein
MTEKRARSSSAPKTSRRVTRPGAPRVVDRELIAKRAYELYAARGYHHGHHVEDWLQAEQELSR